MNAESKLQCATAIQTIDASLSALVRQRPPPTVAVLHQVRASCNPFVSLRILNVGNKQEQTQYCDCLLLNCTCLNWHPVLCVPALW